MQINEKLLLEGIEKLQSLVEENKVKDLFTSSKIKSGKNEIEEVFNNIAKELAPHREQLTLLYKHYDFLRKQQMPLTPINPYAYYYIANTYLEETSFLDKFHNFLEITENDFLHFLYNTFVLDLMCWSKFLGSPLELHLELLFSFKKLWNDERVCENKIKLKEKSDIIVMRYKKILDNVADFEENYYKNLYDQISQFQIEKYLIYHIYIRHIKDTQIDTSGTCFPDDFDNEKLCNLLITILKKPHLSNLGNKIAVCVYHEKQIYTVVFRGNLIHSFYPNEKETIIKLSKEYKEGGKKQIINLKEVPEELL